MGDAITAIGEARALHAAGKPREAYGALGALFASGPDPLGAPPSALAEAAALLAEIARTFGDAALAAKLDTCSQRPDDPNALFDAAYDLYENRQFAAASALLYRA